MISVKMKNIAYIETLSWGLNFLHRSEKRYGLFHFIIPVTTGAKKGMGFFIS